MKDKNGDKIHIGSRVKVEFGSRIRNGVYMPGAKYRGFVVGIEDEYLEVDVRGKMRYAKPEHTETVRVIRSVRANYEERNRDLAQEYKDKKR